MPRGKNFRVMAPAPFVCYTDERGQIELLVDIGAVVEPGDLLAHIESSKSVEGVYYLGTETARVVRAVADGEDARIDRPLLLLRTMGPSHVRQVCAKRRRGITSTTLSVKSGDIIHRGQQIGIVHDMDHGGDSPLRYWGSMGMVKFVFHDKMGFFSEGDPMLLVE